MHGQNMEVWNSVLKGLWTGTLSIFINDVRNTKENILELIKTYGIMAACIKKSLFTKVTRASSWKSSPAIFKLARQRYDQKGLFLFWRHCWWHDLYFVVVILLLFSHYSWTGHTTALQITLNGLSCPNRLTERSERVHRV